jgi:uncharacterized membrane protein YbhN (UPF0104 family)
MEKNAIDTKKVKLLPRIFIIIGIIFSLIIISLYAISFFIVRDLFSLFFWIYPILFALALLFIALACFPMTK